GHHVALDTGRLGEPRAAGPGVASVARGAAPARAARGAADHRRTRYRGPSGACARHATRRGTELPAQVRAAAAAPHDLDHRGQRRGRASREHPVTLRAVLEEMRASAVRGDAEVEIAGLAWDSRQVRVGDLFFALSGLKADGRSFIRQALERGAVATVLVPDGEPLPPGATVVE